MLITTRYRKLASNLLGTAIEVLAFSDTEGSDFLQKVISRGRYSEDEVASAAALSHELGGLPLALNLMGKQVKARGRNIRQYLENYQKNPRRMKRIPKRDAQDVFYDHTLETAWSNSFEPLREQPDSQVLMGILSCLGPERIPKELFDCVAGEEVSWPDDIAFCLDPLE